MCLYNINHVLGDDNFFRFFFHLEPKYIFLASSYIKNRRENIFMVLIIFLDDAWIYLTEEFSEQSVYEKLNRYFLCFLALQRLYERQLISFIDVCQLGLRVEKNSYKGNTRRNVLPNFLERLPNLETLILVPYQNGDEVQMIISPFSC